MKLLKEHFTKDIMVPLRVKGKIFSVEHDCLNKNHSVNYNLHYNEELKNAKVEEFNLYYYGKGCIGLQYIANWCKGELDNEEDIIRCEDVYSYDEYKDIYSSWNYVTDCITLYLYIKVDEIV